MSSITGFLDNYARGIPYQVPARAAQSLIITATTVVTISLIVGHAANVALLRGAIISGAIAALATIIDGVIRPIINAIFKDKNLVFFIQMAIAFCLTASISPWMGFSNKVTIVTIIINQIAWTVLNDGCYGVVFIL